MKTLKLLTGLMVVTAFSVQAETHTVELRNDRFEPAELTIEPGDTVRWVNKGTHAHNVKADDGSFRCAEGCDPPGKSYHGGGGGSGSPGDPSSSNWQFEKTFNTERDVRFHCENHGNTGGIGMSGVVTVKQSEPEAMDLNFGHSGSWYKPEQSGQGFSVEIVPATQEGEPDQLVAYWFTYARGSAGGVNKQRWFVGQGPINGPDAELSVVQVTGGIFDDPENVSSIEVGSATFHATSCTEATLTYSLDLNGDGMEETTGEIALTRLTPDVVCEEMISGSG